MKNAENAGLTNREPEKTFQEMMVAIGDSLSDLASSDDGEYGEYEDDEETEQGNLSKDYEPSGVMGSFGKTVQQRIKRFPQKQIKLDELTQSGWEDAADFIREKDTKTNISELSVPALVQPQTDDAAVAPSPTTFAEFMECLNIIHALSQMPQCTSRPGRSHIRLGSANPQSNTSITGLQPAVQPNSSSLLKA